MSDARPGDASDRLSALEQKLRQLERELLHGPGGEAPPEPGAPAPEAPPGPAPPEPEPDSPAPEWSRAWPAPPSGPSRGRGVGRGRPGVPGSRGGRARRRAGPAADRREPGPAAGPSAPTATGRTGADAGDVLVGPGGLAEVRRRMATLRTTLDGLAATGERLRGVAQVVVEDHGRALVRLERAAAAAGQIIEAAGAPVAVAEARTVVVEAGPFAEPDALAAFRRSLAATPGASDVYLRGFEAGRAVLEVRLEHRGRW